MGYAKVPGDLAHGCGIEVARHKRFANAMQPRDQQEFTWRYSISIFDQDLQGSFARLQGNR